MKRTLFALLLVVVLIFAYTPVWSGEASENSNEEQVEALGEAGGSVFNEQDTYGSNFQMDLYIEKFEMDQTTNWNPQLDAKVEIIKTININKTKTVDVDIDVNKTETTNENKTVDVDVDVNKTETQGEGGEVLQATNEVLNSSNGNGHGNDIEVDIDWYPMCCTEVDIIMENVQISMMSQTGGQYSDMGVDNAYAVGEGSFEMRGLNQNLVQQQLNASNGAVGVQQIATSSATEVLINGGGAVVTTDTYESSGGLGIVD